MSITSAMFTGVSGLLSNAEGINVIGNNLSNVNTIGFKGSRMLFSDMLSTSIGNGSQIGRGTQIQKADNIFSQGSFENTESVTDLAIQGNSFFALGKPEGNAQVAAQSSAFLSRAGTFRVDGSFHLVNPEGYQVLDTAGNPILFQNSATMDQAGDFAKVTTIESSGQITYVDVLGDTYYYAGSGVAGVATSGGVPAPADGNRIAVINPPNAGALDKIGGSLFQNAAGSGIPAAAFTSVSNTANGTTEKMFSNSLEQSNVDMASQFVKMIQTQRAYSANSKTITAADQMTQELLNLVR
ncbi:MAG: flagellar hook basal-body protein [Deltaproteobacteria bacterium]|nr:flagellar hook basal-body protein [Deltaproteobacteria bacterium]